MADQFAVYGNPGRNRQIPYVLVVQSNRFRGMARCVVVPLVAAAAFQAAPSDVGPHFVVEDQLVILDPLQMTNIPRALLTETVTSLDEHEDRIVNAIDVMLSRGWR